MKRIVLPLILSLSFIFESIFVQYFPHQAFGGRYTIVPHFLLVVLLLMGIYYIRNRTILYAFIFGLLFDINYTGILGVYMFLFPFMIYLTSKMMKILQANIFVAGLIVLVDIIIVEFLVYELNILINHVTMSMVDFLYVRLIPTLVLNLIFFIIFSYPMKKWLEKRKKEVLDE
ncbi:rod shape-determining protein MreD [Heyndrickxia vini]|uniref:Rod shape-determining protein MreD n=1 Tax=Heyndrickxia vini TaxID=1476025 RepID=A0ABX7E4Q3_9BACI|nr:rod shape-determining protein MreD [Heyndrickxia vini]QQZ10719.1 rod shape-determining protein MreD [Heyndrickxia vini]